MGKKALIPIPPGDYKVKAIFIESKTELGLKIVKGSQVGKMLIVPLEMLMPQTFMSEAQTHPNVKPGIVRCTFEH